MPERSIGSQLSPLSSDELERLKAVLRRYPNGAPYEQTELEQLYERVGATELIALMDDPELRHRLRRLDPSGDLQWDLLVAWGAFGIAILLVLWLVFRPALP